MPSAVPGLVRCCSAVASVVVAGTPNARAELPLSRDQLGQPEIEKLCMSALSDENVGGLDVSMDDAFSACAASSASAISMPIASSASKLDRSPR